jgi:hypothetical protein
MPLPYITVLLAAQSTALVVVVYANATFLMAGRKVRNNFKKLKEHKNENSISY